MSIQSNIAKLLLRHKIIGWQDGTISEQRAQQEKVAAFARLPAGISYQSIDLDGIHGAWVKRVDPSRGVILYLHGGAYMLGSIISHREFVARLAQTTRSKVLIINYRLAPEDPYPAALEDALAAYKWLLKQGYDPAQIILAGDSAGGGLALAVMLKLRSEGRPLPAGGVCISPWTDLALTGDSYRSKAEVDPMLNFERIDDCAKLYAGQHDRKGPLISPLYGDLRDLPPLFIQVGTDELLLDDAEQFTERAREAGVEVTLEVWQGMFHVFQIFPFLPETKRALESIGQFVARMMNK